MGVGYFMLKSLANKICEQAKTCTNNNVRIAGDIIPQTPTHFDRYVLE
jgi:hypothetical protein